MKYVRGNFNGSIDTNKDKDTTMGKQRLTMPDGFSETPWVAKRSDEPDNVVLLNNALIFMPFHSWGAIIPKGQSDMSAIRAKATLTLHPEAFDQYLEKGMIDAEGNIINDPDYAAKLEAYTSV